MSEQENEAFRHAQANDQHLDRMREVAESERGLRNQIERLSAIPESERDRLVKREIEAMPEWQQEGLVERDPFKSRALRALVLAQHGKEHGATS